MSAAWFHLPELATSVATRDGPARADGEQALRLPREEARHAHGSRRLREGDEVILFDGAGTIATASVNRAERGMVEVRVGVCQTLPPPRHQLILASALPKGERLTTLLGMATQLGITTFVPLTCRRSITPAPVTPPGRWQRLVVEACKQSRRPWLPLLADGCTLPELIRVQPGERDIFLLEREAAPLRLDGAKGGAHQVLLIVGPEGGLEEDEIRTLVAAGARLAALAAPVLRIETAAIAAVATVAQQLLEADHDLLQTRHTPDPEQHPG